MPSHTTPPTVIKCTNKKKTKKVVVTVDADAVQKVDRGVRPRPRRGPLHSFASDVSIEVQRRSVPLHNSEIDKAQLSDLSTDEDEVARHLPQGGLH